MLEKKGTKVTGVGSARDALDIVARRMCFDVLLSDVVLVSEINGRELAHRLVELQPRLRVLLMSGYSAEYDGADHKDEFRLLYKLFRSA
jgi:two-component system cell cycle sensor histidine kinase/response regulator CckA